MKPFLPDLFASDPEPLPFARSVDMRAFLLRRGAGNVLVYSAPGVAADVEGVAALGGVAQIYLSHWHEASVGGADRVAAALDATVAAHADDAAKVAETVAVGATFAGRERVGADLELIPIPGHTPGATALLWTTDGRRVLFTGDSIMLHEGEWIGAVLESSDRAAYIESLELIRELDFDVLVPWAATGGQPFHAETGPEDARRRVDAILERVRRGEAR